MYQHTSDSYSQHKKSVRTLKESLFTHKVHLYNRVMQLLILLAQFAFIGIMLYVIYLLIYSMAKGAPYAPMRHEHLKNMIDVLKIKKGEKAVDIGAGDGRVVIALAHAGAEAHGFEINPLLVLWAKINIRRAGLQGKAHVHLQNFITADFSQFDIFTTYLTKYGMNNVEKKLEKEAKSTARVAADFFPLPTWKPSKHIDTIYLYEVALNRKEKALPLSKK